MARIYRVTLNTAFTAAADLLNVSPADDKPCRLVGMRICQSTEFGDAQEENLRITVNRFPATVTDGSGGAAATPVANDSVQAGSGFTARTGDTTVATTSGTRATLEDIAWNERNSPAEFWWPEPDMQPKVYQGERLIVRQETTPADSLTLNCTFFIAEE